jgi:hypothetical protein
VRDTEGAERCITTAVRSGAEAPALAELMFSAATDHRYLTTGYVLDFTNKAFEALDHGAHDLAEPVLASLARSYATGERMEESNEWRNPIDLIAICERAFESIPAALEAGRHMRSRSWSVARGAGRHGRIRGGASDRAIPHQQRVWRLGHGTSQLYFRKRCAPGHSTRAIGGAAARRV